jgi:PAS domain S-box-containing protein
MADPLRVAFVGLEPAEGSVSLPGTDREATVGVEPDPAAALDRVEDGSVDCVVAEYDLPGTTGVELLREVGAVAPGLPVVLYTDADPAAFAGAAVEADLSAYVDRDDGGEEELWRAVDRALDAGGDGGGGGREFEGDERFKAIIEQSSDIVSILDREGTYVYQSPSVESVLGYDPEAFVGQDVFGFVHPDDRERVRTEFFAAVENPDRTPTVEYRFQHRDGSWRVMESRGTNMIDDPVVDGLVVNSRDVTERRRREQRMNVLNRTLRHDLRNAMNVILGNAELLMREYGTDDRAETVRSTAADMLALSDKVREIERALDSSDRPREMVDLVSVVEGHLSAVRRSRPDVTLEVDLPESEWVLANDRIGAAVDNAVENAIEHNDADDPLVRVTVAEAVLAGDDAVTLTVADNGPGLPEEERAVIAGGGETPLEHTSGLGLWLIKWIVAESAGEVEFGESPEGGTAVRLTLRRASVGRRIDVG